jgi:peptidoglycan/LPS O-acetylase OafA/YrhL
MHFIDDVLVVYDSRTGFRAPPYLIGLLVYFMVSHSRRSLLASHEHTRCFRWSLALVSATCMSLAVLLPFDFYRAAPTPWSQHAQSVWLALQRPLFTVGVALLCWLCTAGLGGWVGKFLGSRYWAPLSRLSYCGYLIHPVIMFYWYFAQQQYFDFSIPWYAMNFLGFLSMTFVAAAVLHLTVEAPVSNLVKLIWP